MEVTRSNPASTNKADSPVGGFFPLAVALVLSVDRATSFVVPPPVTGWVESVSEDKVSDVSTSVETVVSVDEDSVVSEEGKVDSATG